ncbi:hypothetical protein ACIBUY_18100 [Streptomyces sp. NPDC050085]|uniref:hypothetical protein n=1 Tax=Streptomyces sp. NPDC050085 TaxID=3365600 RepID=UPI0037988630
MAAADLREMLLVARGIVAEALADPVANRRTNSRSCGWDIDFDVLLDEVRHVLAIALFATAPDDATADPGSPQHRHAALLLLQSRDPIPVFAPLPARPPEELALPLKQLWLMSVSATDRSGLHWVRLLVTASDLLSFTVAAP